MFAAERSCDRAAVRGVDVHRRRQRRPLEGLHPPHGPRPGWDQTRIDPDVFDP